MLTLPAANTGTPDGAEGLRPQPATTPEIATHTSTLEGVIASPDSVSSTMCSAIDDARGYLAAVLRTTPTT
jgi:hypothetical protein